MTGMLVGLDEVLAKLGEHGPLSTAEIAGEFGLNPLDARILMLHAHVHSLVRRTDWGEWAITAHGREAVAVSAGERVLSAPRELAHRGRGGGWHYGWQGAMVVAACVIACAVIAGVPGRFGASAGRTAAQVPAQQAATLATGHRSRHGRDRVRDGKVVLSYEFLSGRSGTAARERRLIVTRSEPRTVLALDLPESVSRQTAKTSAGTTPASLRMATNRARAASRTRVDGRAGCESRTGTAGGRRAGSRCGATPADHRTKTAR